MGGVPAQQGALAPSRGAVGVWVVWGRWLECAPHVGRELAVPCSQGMLFPEVPEGCRPMIAGVEKLAVPRVVMVHSGRVEQRPRVASGGHLRAFGRGAPRRVQDPCGLWRAWGVGDARSLLCVCWGPSSRGSCCVGSLQLFRGALCPSDPPGGGPAVAARSSAGPALVGTALPPSQVLFSRQPESL